MDRSVSDWFAHVNGIHCSKEHQTLYDAIARRGGARVQATSHVRPTSRQICSGLPYKTGSKERSVHHLMEFRRYMSDQIFRTF